MARQFQGYARGRGFSSRNPGSAAVSRIQEQGNKTISGLRQQLQSKRQQDQQYIADLDSNFRRGEQIKDEIKSFEDKAFNLKMANVKRNQNQHLENIKTEAQNQADTNKQLAEFSQTLGQTALNVGTQIQMAQDEAASTVNKISGANRSTYADQAVAEELEKNDIANENKLAKVATENGLPEHTRQEQRALSPNRQVKGKKAAVAEAWNQYSTRATYNNYGPDLAHKIFKELGLLDSNDRLFTEFADKYEQLNLAFKTTNSRTRAVNQSNELDTKATAQFFNNPTSETLFHAWQTHKAGTDDGRGPRNNKAATDYLFGTLLTSLNLSDEQVLDLLQNTNLRDENGNKLEDTFYSRFENTRVQKLLIDRRDSSVKSVTDREKVVKAEQTQNYLDALEAVDQLGEIDDPTSYIAELDDVDLSKQQRNLLSERITDNSKFGKEQKNVDRQLQYAYDNGQPMDQIFLQAKGKTRNKWKSIVAEVNGKMQGAGVSDTENRKRLLKQGKLRLNVQSIDKIYDSSLDFATDDRLAKVQKRRQELIRIDQMDYASANNQAMAEQIDLIDNSNLPEYKPEGAATGDGSTHNFYGHYSPGGGYFTNVVQANKHQALQAVRARPDSIKDVFLAPTSYYAGVYDSITKNQPIPESDLFNSLHKVYPDALQLQLNKYTTEKGLPPVTIPLTQNQYLAANAEDPRLKQFALRMDTIQEERIYPVAADPLARSHPRFKSDVVNQRRLIMEIPAVEGGITGLTVQDYDELAYIASAEAGPGDDPYLVAATALNRLASGKYGNSLYDIARAEGQYEAVYTGKAYYDPARAKEFASPAGQRKLHGMLILLDGRTDFKGQSQLHNRHESDVMVHPKGNFAHRAGETPNSGVYTGPIDYSFRRFLGNG